MNLNLGLISFEMRLFGGGEMERSNDFIADEVVAGIGVVRRQLVK